MVSRSNEHEIGTMKTMKYIDRYIEFFYEKFGPSVHECPAPEKLIGEYMGKVPETLISYWKEYGWCGYNNGIFWTVNPDKYKRVVSEWLSDTPFESKDNYHLIGLGAFGEMILWGEETGNSLTITPSHGMIFYTDKSEFIAKNEDGYNTLIKSLFSSMKKWAPQGISKMFLLML